ncbi:hypothetical protein A8926_0186 [Saccharopolyspora spinosa]|uniref:Uncharacterized protein n=1 Tax=Saccharopolyspora spinosa TaxID=60894 RepID=A0A2N3XPW9_SACSN|nr:hypothetical protein A8926_0186 [Saccharopolyspora spinosa]
MPLVAARKRASVVAPGVRLPFKLADRKVSVPGSYAWVCAGTAMIT